MLGKAFDDLKALFQRASTLTLTQILEELIGIVALRLLTRLSPVEGAEKHQLPSTGSARVGGVSAAAYAPASASSGGHPAARTSARAAVNDATA